MALLFGMFSTHLIHQGIASSADATLLQMWFELRGPRESPDHVTIVRYDRHTDKASDSSATQPEAILQLARAVDAATAAGAKMLMLDFVFNEDCSPNTDVLAKSLVLSPSVIGMYTSDTLIPEGKGTLRSGKTETRPSKLFTQSAKELMNLQVTSINGVVQSLMRVDLSRTDTKVTVPFLRPLRRFFARSIEEPPTSALINYYGGHSSVPSVSISDFTSSEEVAKRYAKGKVVLIGEHGIAQPRLDKGRDTHRVSVTKKPMYGVEIQATIAANLIDRSWIEQPSLHQQSLLSYLVVWLLSFGALSLSPLRAAVPTLASGILWAAASFYLFIEHYYFLPGLAVFGIVMPIMLLSQWIWVKGVLPNTTAWRGSNAS